MLTLCNMLTVDGHDLSRIVGGSAAGWRCAFKSGGAGAATLYGTYIRDEVYHPVQVAKQFGPGRALVFASLAGLAVASLSKDCPGSMK